MTVGAFEAKTHLPSLLDKVEKGAKITITRHGIPVAELVPIAKRTRRDLQEVIEELKNFRKGKSLPPGMTIKDLINEGRKY